MSSRDGAVTEELQLLREYAATGSQPAFAELSRRYVDLVYSSARRQLRGDAHEAEDVTQAVFLVLSRKAKSIPDNRPLSAWLIKVTSYCAANARRAKDRRTNYERRAADMAPITTAGESDADWESLSPLLDQGLSKLPATDRDALLLRFLEKKSLRQVGDALGISEEAAQKRVVRAIDKLRGYFHRKGVTTMSSAGLSTILAAKATELAPAKLAAAVASPAITGTSASVIAKGALLTMGTQKAIVGGAVALSLLLVAGGGVIAVQQFTSSPKARTVQLAATGAPANAPATQPGKLTFPNGVTVELIGMTEVLPPGPAGWLADLVGAPNPPGKDSDVWWGTDGSQVQALDLKSLGNVSVGAIPGRRMVRFVIATRGLTANTASTSVRIANTTSTASSSRFANGELITNYVCSVPADLQSTEITGGLAYGPWHEAASYPVNAAATSKPTGAKVFRSLDEEDGQTVVQIDPSQWPRGDWRAEAVLKSGKRVNFTQYQGTGNNEGHIVFNCRKADVEKIVWLSRPYTYASMGEVKLQHAAATTQPSAATR